jgi:hypothetical protein
VIVLKLNEYAGKVVSLALAVAAIPLAMGWGDWSDWYCTIYPDGRGRGFPDDRGGALPLHRHSLRGDRCHGSIGGIIVRATLETTSAE